MLTIFSTLSIVAIIAGGAFSAFTAHKSTRLTAWVSAYLVLVVGIVQLGVTAALYQLNLTADVLSLVALSLYNLGNAGVIIGTTIKTKSKHYRWFVNAGGLLMAAAMAGLLSAIRHSTLSWAFVGLVGLAIIIFISMPIGVVLSGRKSVA